MAALERAKAVPVIVGSRYLHALLARWWDRPLRSRFFKLCNCGPFKQMWHMCHSETVLTVFKTVEFGFWGILGQPGNHTSQWIRDLWSKGVSLILAYF